MLMPFDEFSYSMADEDWVHTPQHSAQAVPRKNERKVKQSASMIWKK